MYYEDQCTPAEINDKLSAQGHDIRGVRDVRSLIDRARAAHLVRVRVEDTDKAPAIDQDLGERLAKAAGLRKAVVITSSLASDADWASPDPKTRARAFDDADILHASLGATAAQYLLDILRPGDAVGIGPGRGTGIAMRCLEWMVEDRPIALPDLRVFALSGKMWVQAWREREMWRGYLDADENTLTFAHALQVDAERVSLVGLPLFVDATGEQKENFVGQVAPYLLSDHWKDELDGKAELDISIFGVGSVNASGSHYAVVHPGPHPGVALEIAELRAVAQEIESLQADSGRGSDVPLAIVDIGDRFWVWSNGPETRLHRRARKIVDQLNEKMVSVSFGKLQAARQRVVVAGGHQKYTAVLALLARGEEIGVQATVLVTDEWTATRLLEDLPAPATAPPATDRRDGSGAWLSHILERPDALATRMTRGGAGPWRP